MALRKKKTKAAKTKAGKGKAKAAKAKAGKAGAKPAKGKAKKPKKAAAPAAAPAPAKPDGKALLEHLDALHSLDEVDIRKIRDVCDATLEYRGRLRELPIEDMQADVASEYCYTKSGASSNVSIWKDAIKVEETTQQDAEARGIRPC